MRKVTSALCILLTLSLPSGATEVTHMTFEEVLPDISHVLVINVTKIESVEKYRHFPDKEKVLTSSTTILHGTIIEKLLGNTDQKIIVTQHTEEPHVIYSENGEIETYFSPILKSSGEENDVEVGKSYIVSFEEFGEISPYSHVRVDRLENKTSVKKLIVDRKKN